MPLVSRRNFHFLQASRPRIDAPAESALDVTQDKPLRHEDKKAGTFERHIHGYRRRHARARDRRGVYPPGSLLPNVPELCERFGVSRTALREAYNLLTAKALIVARPKVGTRVRPRAEWHMFDPDVLAWHLEAGPGLAFVSDLFVLRQMVEPAAAALAAECRSDETIDRIAEAFPRMERFRDGGGGLIEADLDFHMAILESHRKSVPRRARRPHPRLAAGNVPTYMGGRGAHAQRSPAPAWLDSRRHPPGLSAACPKANV